MHPDTIGRLVLIGYAALAAGLILRDVRRCREGWPAWLLYRVNQLYSGWGFHWRSNRRCPFPTDGPALIIANHSSPVDPQIVWNNHSFGGHARRIRQVQFLTAREYFDVPGVGWICRSAGAIPVSRDGRDMEPIRFALRLLEKGAWIGVFPEGRINRNRESLLPGDTGVAWLALRSGVPVYPVYIHNAPQGETMVGPFLNLRRVAVTYGDPIDLSAFRERRKSAALLQEVANLLMSRLAELGGVSYQPAPRAPVGKEDTRSGNVRD